MNRSLLVTVSLALFGHGLAATPEALALTLSEAEIIKLQWDTRDLTAADIDADDRQDLAVINNDEARIDLYYQLAPGEKPGQTERKTSVDRWDPILEDARFERIKVLTGGVAYDLALGDLNQDQRVDLVYTNDRNEIVVHWQGENGDWSNKRYFEFEKLIPLTLTLWIGDLANDNKPDLVCMTQEGLLIFRDGNLEKRPTRYPCVADAPKGLTVRDLNDDGRLDIVYYDLKRSDKSAMIVRFQSEDGQFVGERFFEFKRTSNIPVPINWGQNGEQTFAAVSAANHTLVKLTTGPLRETKPNDDRNGFQRQAYAVPSAGNKDSHYAMADFNGDDRLDIVASDGAGAQVWYFQQTEQGNFAAPESFPAFADINGLAAGDVDQDGRAELIVMSSEEGVIGVAHYTADQRFDYPAVVPLDSPPTQMTIGNLDSDEAVEILCTVEGESNRKHNLVLIDFKDTWVTTPLPHEINARLQGLQLADINQDGHQDILAPSLVQSLEVLLHEGNGSYKALNGTAAGLADKVAPFAISQADLDADGHDELLVTRDTFARSARLGKNGRAEILDQINAPDVSANLLVSLAIDLDGDETPELLLIDGAESKIHVMARDAKSVYRFSKSHPGIPEITGSHVADADGDGTPDLFLFTKDHFWWYALQQDDFVLKETQLYETDLKNTVYADILAGSLDNDAKDDLVVFDTAQNHVMEILLTRDSDGNESAPLHSALHFKLFEVDPHFQGQRGSRFQPHGAILADLNADGRQDIAALVHDRLIIYPQD